MGGFGHHVFAIRSDKDEHFTTAIPQNNGEDENLVLPGSLGGRSRIVGARIISMDNLAWAVTYWGNDSFTNDTDIDLTRYLGHYIWAVGDGKQRNASGPYYYVVWDLDIPYIDLDHPKAGVPTSPRLHIALGNLSVAPKTAGINGAVVVETLMIPTN